MNEMTMGSDIDVKRNMRHNTQDAGEIVGTISFGELGNVITNLVPTGPSLPSTIGGPRHYSLNGEMVLDIYIDYQLVDPSNRVMDAMNAVIMEEIINDNKALRSFVSEGPWHNGIIKFAIIPPCVARGPSKPIQVITEIIEVAWGFACLASEGTDEFTT